MTNVIIAPIIPTSGKITEGGGKIYYVQYCVQHQVYKNIKYYYTISSIFIGSRELLQFSTYIILQDMNISVVCTNSEYK